MFSQVGFSGGDGLTPTLELRDTTNTAIAGYAASSTGIIGVGSGSGNYTKSYAIPAGYTEWLEVWTDGVSGGEVKTSAVNVKPVTVAVNNDKAGYSLTTAPPTASAIASAVQAILPVEFLTSAEQGQLTSAITDLLSLLGRTDTGSAVAGIQSIVTAIKAKTDTLTFTGSDVNAHTNNLPADYAQRETAPSWYVAPVADVDLLFVGSAATSLTFEGQGEMTLPPLVFTGDGQ